MPVHKRYLCSTPECEAEFLPGGSILKPGPNGTPQGTEWQPEDGCPKCGGSVEIVSYTPATPGLDIPRDTATFEPVQPIALPPREKDGTNPLLAPDPRPLEQLLDDELKTLLR